MQKKSPCIDINYKESMVKKMYIIYSIPLIFIILPVLAILGLGAQAAHFVAEYAFVIGIAIIALKLGLLALVYFLNRNDKDMKLWKMILSMFCEIISSIIFMSSLLRYANVILEPDGFFSMIGGFIAILFNTAATVVGWLFSAAGLGLVSVGLSLAVYLICIFW